MSDAANSSEHASVFSVEEAGSMLGLSRASAYAAAERGDIPTVRIGRRLLVPRAQLELMLRGEVTTAHPPSRSRSPNGRRIRQLKIGFPEEMVQEIDQAAKAAGISFAEEVRQRVAAFREEHRLVEVTRWVRKGDLPRTSDA